MYEKQLEQDPGTLRGSGPSESWLLALLLTALFTQLRAAILFQWLDFIVSVL